MKKIFMVSLVAMMAVTAANADIASTSYVQARTGEMTIGADGKVTDANYAAQNQILKVVAETDALNAAIGKLDAAITQQATDDGNTYVKKVEANEEKKGGTAGTFVYSVEQVEGDVAAAEGTFLSEIVSGDLPAAQVNAYKVAPQAGAVKSYVDGAISAQGTQVTNLSGRVGAVEEYIAGNETKGIESLDERLGAKVDIAQGEGSEKKLMNTDKDGNVVAGEIKKNTTDTTTGSFITGLSVDNDGNLVYTDGKVGTGDIEDGAVTTAKIANKAVTTDKIADKAVTTAQLSDEINTSLGNAVQRSQVGMPVDFAISEACKAQGVVCSLTIKGTGTGAVAQWEVVR